MNEGTDPKQARSGGKQVPPQGHRERGCEAGGDPRHHVTFWLHSWPRTTLGHSAARTADQANPARAPGLSQVVSQTRPAPGGSSVTTREFQNEIPKNRSRLFCVLTSSKYHLYSLRPERLGPVRKEPLGSGTDTISRVLGSVPAATAGARCLPTPADRLPMPSCRSVSALQSSVRTGSSAGEPRAVSSSRSSRPCNQDPLPTLLESHYF